MKKAVAKIVTLSLLLVSAGVAKSVAKSMIDVIHDEIVYTSTCVECATRGIGETTNSSSDPASFSTLPDDIDDAELSVMEWLKTIFRLDKELENTAGSTDDVVGASDDSSSALSNFTNTAAIDNADLTIIELLKTILRKVCQLSDQLGSDALLPLSTATPFD